MIIDIIKKYKIIIVVVGIIIVSGCLIKFGTEIFKQKKYENEIIDALNNDTMYDFINEKEMKSHKYAKMEVPSEYNITPVIDIYLENVYTCIENKIGNGNKKCKSINAMPIGDNMLVNGFKYGEFDYVVNLISDEDIENYNKGIFKSIFISKLRQTIKHREENGKINWYIDNDYNKIIEMPYNVYIDFRYSDKKNTGVKEVKRIKFLDKNNEMCHIEYEMNDGTIKKEEFGVIKKTKNNIKGCKINSFNSIYYDITHEARLTFGQHDYDKQRQEEREAFLESERLRYEAEEELKKPEHQKDIVHTDIKVIPIFFEKYEFSPDLLMYTLRDGSTKSYFQVVISSIINVNNERETIYKYRELPYDDMTFDDALAKYMTDEKEYKEDEKMLNEKKCNKKYKLRKWTPSGGFVELGDE